MGILPADTDTSHGINGVVSCDFSQKHLFGGIKGYSPVSGSYHHMNFTWVFVHLRFLRINNL